MIDSLTLIKCNLNWPEIRGNETLAYLMTSI